MFLKMKTTTKISAGVLSIIPGLGHILTGRYIRGYIFFFSFLIFIDLAFIILPFVLESYQINAASQAFIIAAVIIWFYSVIDIARIIWWREREIIQKRKIPLFHKVFILYLQNNLAEAEKNLRKLLKIDRDDLDTLFYLGVIYHGQGKRRRARYYFNKSLQLDETQKWQWEISKISES